MDIEGIGHRRKTTTVNKPEVVQGMKLRSLED